MNSNGLSYMNLLKAYYLLDLPSLLGTKASHLFLSLLHKANMTGFKTYLTIPNSILQGMSGIHVPSSFHRTRKTLLDFQLDRKHIVKYTKPPNVHQCGTYQINYDALLDSLPSYSQYGSETAHDMGVKPGTYTDKTRIENNTCKEVATLGDPYVILINKKCGTMWSPQSGRQADSLRELEDEFPFNIFKPVFLKIIDKTPTLKPPGVIPYMLKVLRNQPTPPKEPMQFATTEELNAKGIYTINEAIQKEIEEDPDNIKIDF